MLKLKESQIRKDLLIYLLRIYLGPWFSNPFRGTSPREALLNHFRHSFFTIRIHHNSTSLILTINFTCFQRIPTRGSTLTPLPYAPRVDGFTHAVLVATFLFFWRSAIKLAEWWIQLFVITKTSNNSLLRTRKSTLKNVREKTFILEKIVIFFRLKN